MRYRLQTLYGAIVSLCLSSLMIACKHNPDKHQAVANKDTTRVKDSVLYSSPKLIITRIGPHTAVHTSYLQTHDFGNVPCNGMIVMDQGKALIFDTPADDSSAAELIAYLEQQQVQIDAVVATHFHVDCVGGLKAFHQHKIPSYASQSTVDLLKAKEKSATLPQHAFEGALQLSIGKDLVTVSYFGAGHTRDNVVAYYAKDRVLFGGCLIKETGAGKGNLEDADTLAWSGTVWNVKEAYPDVKVVIPGHGQWGDQQLLDYTIKLFEGTEVSEQR